MKQFVLLLCTGLLVACADDAKEASNPSEKISAPLTGHDTAPLWANIPKTISLEWGSFFSKKGQGRDWVYQHLLDD